jgi:cell division transport system permease protein
MNAWLRAHVTALARACRRMVRQPMVSSVSILVIGIAIMLPVTLYAVFANVSAAASRLNTDPNVNVYLQIAAKDDEARDIERRLKALTNVADVKFITRESALAMMKKDKSVADLLAGLETNPLPHAFALRPRATDDGALENLRKEIQALPKIDSVVMDFEWAKKLKRFAAFAERLVTLLGGVLALAVVFVTGNTIRLQILTQQDEIEVSRLIGASKRYVRRPFLYFGALQGAIAGAVGIGLVLAIIRWAGREVTALTASYGSDFSLAPPAWPTLLAVVGIAAVLGWLGAYASVTKYLYGLSARK